jgi:tetratricopeptide (TPR) repeat protein/Zn-dependent protease
LARLVSWLIIVLAFLGIASLMSLPLFAREAAEQINVSRPEELPPKPQIPEEHQKPLVPVSELHEALKLPRVDKTLTDEHSRASLAAYRAEDYQAAFEESVLALDPTPLGENELYRVLTTLNAEGLAQTTNKPNGRPAIRPIDDALQPIVQGGNPHLASRLNNAASMFILYLRTVDPTAYPQDPSMAYAAQELAYQAADAEPSYCPALLNLTLFGAMVHPPGVGDLTLPGNSLGYDDADAWMEYYPSEGCKDPALLYHRAQNSIFNVNPWFQGGSLKEEYLNETLELTDELLKDPQFAGLAHAVRGEAYYWYGAYNLELSIGVPRPFTARRYFELALQEYDSALALQPDDTAIRNGKALAYLELGEAENALREATAALEAAPDSYRFRRTLIDAFEAKRKYATAARLTREALSAGGPTARPSPLALVPYTPLSHGSDAYSDLLVPPPEVGGAGGALFDEDVIRPFVPRSYNSSARNFFAPGGVDQQRAESLYYDLLRFEFLSGDLSALNEDLENVPEPALQNQSTLLLIATHRLLNPQESPTTPEVQEALDASAPVYGERFYWEAGNFFRQHGQYEKAIRVYSLWKTELEHTGADGKRLAEAENQLGEAYFLNGQNEKALAAFESAQASYQEAYPSDGVGEDSVVWPPYLVREAFIHEQLGDYDRAAELYRRTLEAIRRPEGATDIYGASASYSSEDYYHAAKHLGDMLLRQARNFEAARGEGENIDDVRARYLEAAVAYGEALKYPYPSSPPQTASAANNLGIALIKAQRYEEAIEALKPLVGNSADAPAAWETPPTPDRHNPIFHLNLGWAYELSDQPEKAKEHYLAAVMGDPTFHPAFNDLGVLAAKSGELGDAQGYFEAALEAKPDYDYAAYNLGVALLRSGPQTFLAAQHYLARAVGQNDSLGEASYDYVFDNELYFLNLSLGTSVPPDWEFATRAERSTFVVSLGAVVILLWGILLRIARQKGRETFIGKVSEALREKYGAGASRLWARVRDGWLRISHLGRPSSGRWWITPLALLITTLAVTVAQGWSLLWADSPVKPVMIAALVYVAFVSLLVHHAGHAVVALRSRLRVTDAPWPAGIAQAIVLVAVGGPFVAPMPATSVEGKGDERRRQLVLLAGPLATIMLAMLLYALYAVSHVPVFRFGTILNLGLAAASLLSLPPLEGATIGQGHYRRWAIWAATFVAVMSTLVVITSLF